ncbi:MAG: hypothetical protein ACHQC8_01780 [Solirubrobacterales bacterium]
MNARSLTVTASDSPRVLRVLLAALAALALACATALAGSAPALAAGCLNEKGESNEAVRAEANSTQLAQCRAYELVSPQYTAGVGVSWGIGAGSAPDGEAAQFMSVGGFAGAGNNYAFNWYIARRGKEGWKTSWVGLPATVIQGEPEGTNISFDLTKGLMREHSFNEVKDSLFVSDDLAAAPVFSLAEPTGFREIPGEQRELVGVTGLKVIPENIGEVVGGNPDFSHVVIGQPIGKVERLYDLAGVGGPAPEPSPRIVNIVPGTKESVLPGTSGLGASQGVGAGSQFHAISNDGSEIFFTSAGVSYVRVNQSRTLPLGGGFFAASEDGSKVFVGSGGLYMDVIDSEPGHEGVTRKITIARNAQSNIYLRSSDDGSHVYFDSTGVLAANENENNEKAVLGAHNLYVYDTVTEKAAFIAQALPGTNANGLFEAQVNGCPSRELGESGEPGCEGGRFFVFATTAKITPDDTSGAQQVFEYDAGSGSHPPTLVRVSIGEGGYADNGNEGATGASIVAPEYAPTSAAKATALAEDSTRALSDDGSTVVFETARALSPRAVNGLADVYEYHEGRVGLISTGHSLTPDSGFEAQPTIAPSGRDIFFMTTENVVPQDSDGLMSLYDARIDGGFPPPAVEEGGCTGDSCQGPPSVPNLLGAGASATFSGLGNPAPPAPTPAVKPKPKFKPKACKKGYVKKKSRCVKRSKAKKAGNDRRTKQ